MLRVGFEPTNQMPVQAKTDSAAVIDKVHVENLNVIV
jgi:hypothetical protein